MSEVHRFSRLWLTLALLLVSSLILTCKTPDPGAPGGTAPAPAPAPIAPSRSGPSVAPETGPCNSQGKGDENRDRPIVCVDDSAGALSVHPDPVRAHEVMSTDRKTPPVIQWFTRSGRGDLKVEFKDAGCVTDIDCNKNGHCKAKVIPLGGAGEKRCKYDVLLEGHPTLDPDTIIVGCCG